MPEMLTTLKSIVQEMNQVAGLDAALSKLVTRVKEAVNCDACSVYLANYDTESFVLMATDGLAKEVIGLNQVGFSEGLIGLVGQREEPINIANARSHPRFKHAPEVKEDDFNSFLGTPIIHQRKVLGIIMIQQKESRFFNQEEEAFLVTLAAQIATEVAHAEARGLFDKDSQQWVKNLQGVPGSSGLCIGTGFVIRPKADFADIFPRLHNGDEEWEIRRYRLAIKKTQRELKKLAENLGSLPEETHSIFQSYQYLLDAKSLGNEVEKEIQLGWNANSALKTIVEKYVANFAAMDDPYIRERGSDLRDLGQRVLAYLISDEQEDRVTPKQSILVAHEVTAAMLAEFPKNKLKGIISVVGSNNSHAAILARAMGVPAVMGLRDVNVSQLEGEEIILDGYSGKVFVQPQDFIRNEYLSLIAEEEELYKQVDEQKDLAAETTDGVTISLRLNIGLSDVREEYQDGACEGIGLYRTEVPFMERERFPTEEEQSLLYRKVLEGFPDKPVVMRTLDVGGDKPLPYFPIAEDNPFLGWRGIRMTLDHPEIFLVQIRAMLRASIGHPGLHIMLPMITSIAEIDESLRLAKQAFYEVEEEASAKGQLLKKPKYGVMIEVPAVLYQLEQVAKRVDFFSVGTNDLTQYLLAVDRNNPSVASIYDSHHPAVLNALQHIIDTSTRLAVPTAVCGEMAGDPGGAVLLMAMGFNELSMSQRNLQKIKWVIRNISCSSAKELLADVLQQENPVQVKNKVSQFLETAGLGGLVRAGK